MHGRTIILVSHHVQLCASGASYIVALDNGRVQFQGSGDAFQKSDVLSALSQSKATDSADTKEETLVPSVEEAAAEKTLEVSATGQNSETSSTIAPTSTAAETKSEKKAPRKLIEEEKRAVGRISTDIWVTYLKACGGVLYWTVFCTSLLLGAASPVLENGWLRYVYRSSLLCIALIIS